MSEFGEFGGLPTAPDPALSPSFEAPASPRRSVDWAKILPALGLVAGALHGHRARKKLMDLTGEHVSRRRVLDEALYGATLGWVPQALKDAKDGMSGQNKTAGVGTGAVLGNLGFGPLGAGLGAEISKDDQYRYHGSPGVRAAVGSVGGGLGGLGTGILLGALLANRRRSEVLHPTTGILSALLAGGGSTYGAYAGAKSVDRSHRSEMPKHAAFRPFASKKSVGSAALSGAGVGAGVGGALGATPGAVGMAIDKSSFGRAVALSSAVLDGGVGAVTGAPVGAAANALRAGVHNAKIDRDRATLGKGLLLASGAVALGAGAARLTANKEKKADASALRVALGAGLGSALGHGIKMPLANKALVNNDPAGALSIGLLPLGTYLSGLGAGTQGGGRLARTLARIGHLSGDVAQVVGHSAGAHPAATIPLPALGAALGAGIGHSRELAAQRAKRNLALGAKRNLALGAGAAGLAGAAGGLALANRNKDKK